MLRKFICYELVPKVKLTPSIRVLYIVLLTNYFRLPSTCRYLFRNRNGISVSRPYKPSNLMQILKLIRFCVTHIKLLFKVHDSHLHFKFKLLPEFQEQIFQCNFRTYCLHFQVFFESFQIHLHDCVLHLATLQKYSDFVLGAQRRKI